MLVGAGPARSHEQRATAQAHGVTPSRGIVQEIRKDNRIRLRAIDGVDTVWTLALKAQILINDRPGVLRDIQPGFVAEVVLNKRGRVATLKAFGEVPLRTVRGVVEQVTPTGVVIKKADLKSIVFTIDPASRILLVGVAATAADIQVGYAAVIQYRGSAPPESISLTPPLTTDRGIIDAITETAVTLRRAGVRTTLSVGPATVVLVSGQAATTSDLKPGQLVAVDHRGPTAATTIRVLPGK
jgi:hypothetical protein